MTPDTPDSGTTGAEDADRALAFTIWKDAKGHTELSMVGIATLITAHRSAAVAAQSAELEALRATVVRMREALEPFADCDANTMGRIPDNECYLWKPTSTNRETKGISVANIKDARSAPSLVPADLAECVVVKRSEWEKLRRLSPDDT